MNVRRFFTLALASLSVGACELVTEPSCDICTTSAVVQGTVSAEGAAVEGAAIWYSIGDAACSNVFSSGPPDAVSEADGSFELHIITGFSPAERCVTLYVEPPPGFAQPPQHSDEFTVRFRADHLRNAVRDTVEVHVSLVTPP